jgi:hypothetical protein
MVQTLFGGAGYLSILFTERAREWFSESLGDATPCASPKFYAHYEWRDSLPRRLARPGYPFTLERQESLPEEHPSGIPVYPRFPEVC